MKTPLLGDREFYVRVAAIGFPIALQSLLTTSGSMVDTMMIGSLGELTVAAVGICARFSSLLFSAFFGFLAGGITFFSQYWGAKNEKGISMAFGLASTCMMFISALACVAAVCLPEFVMGVYTDKPAIREIAIPYLRIVGFSFPLQVLAFAISALMRSTEQVRIPLYASIAALVTNVFFNWALIYGKLGFPVMGVRGAAVATVMGNAVNVIVLYVYCFLDKKRPFLRAFRDYYRWNLGFIKLYFKKSLFMVANEVFMGAGFMIADVVIGRQDEMAIAALAVFRVIEGIVFSFYRGFTNAGSVIVGMEIGTGSHLRGYTRAKQLALLSPVSVFVMCLIQYMYRAPLLGIFGLGETAYQYGNQMLLIYIFTATVRLCNWVSNDIFRAAGESVFGTVVEIICMYCFTIPAMLLTGLYFRLPFAVVFACMYTDDIIRVALIAWYMNSGKWVKPVTDEGRAALPEFRRMLAGERGAVVNEE